MTCCVANGPPPPPWDELPTVTVAVAIVLAEGVRSGVLANVGVGLELNVAEDAGVLL